MNLLSVQNLSRSFGGLRAVDSVGFHVAEKTIHAVIGPNGAGKTTLFNLLAGAITPDQGEIVYEGRPIQGLPPHRIASLGILRTFQNLKLFPHLSVLDNILTGLHGKGGTGMITGLLRTPNVIREEKIFTEKAVASADKLGLAPLLSREARHLSFGEQRAVELARALVAGPRLLLLDEPAAGLNIHETRLLAGQIRSIRERGITVLLVEHDMSLVMDIADRVTVLASGKKIADGTPPEIQRNPEVVRVYLGDGDA